jgi:hypothetical protein
MWTRRGFTGLLLGSLASSRLLAAPFNPSWSASPNGKRNVFDNMLDFSSFGGAPGASGATNVAAVAAFNAAYAGLSGRTQLYIPPGTYNFSSQFNIANTAPPAGSSLVIEAYGVTIAGPSGTASAVANNAGIVQGADNFKETRIFSANAGDSTVTLVTSSETSRYSAGKWVAVTGINMQGAGDPPNPGIFEFKKILNVGTGTLTFTEPLVNTYLDTWPAYPGGGVGRGGPASVYPLQGAWDQEVEFRGATFADTNNLAYGKVRIMQWTDCTFATFGPCPSVNLLYRSIRCAGPGIGALEVDKFVERAEFIDSTHRAVDFQSASVNDLYVYNVVQTGATATRWRGGARRSNVFIGLSTSTFNFGEMNYGCMGPASLTDCFASASTFFNQTSPFSDYTEEGGGVLSYPGGPGSASNPTHWWGTPGANAVLLDSSNNFARSFQISDVYQSAGRTYIATNLPFPVPSTINGRSAPWKIIAHPCPSVTITNSSGNAQFAAQSALPAGSPFNNWTL